MDLRRQVSRKVSKKKSKGYKKREDRKYLQGRTYKDYKQYVAENPDVFVTEVAVSPAPLKSSTKIRLFAMH
jgi:hypothetical protein